MTLVSTETHAGSRLCTSAVGTKHLSQRLGPGMRECVAVAVLCCRDNWWVPMPMLLACITAAILCHPLDVMAVAAPAVLP
jgi:hypothetical protein